MLSCELASVTIGRHFVRDTLLRWDLERLVGDAELGVSELVANAVRHARSDVRLIVCAGTEVTFAVSDREPVLHRPIGPDDWGIEARDGGKSIWFSLTLPDHSLADAELHNITQLSPVAAQSAEPGSPTAALG